MVVVVLYFKADLGMRKGPAKYIPDTGRVAPGPSVSVTILQSSDNPRSERSVPVSQ